MNEKYFNFPICMLRGFMNDTSNVLQDVLDYCTVKYMIDNNCDYETARKFFCYTTTKDIDELVDKGGRLNRKIKDKRFTGIKETYNTDLYWDFYKNKKSDFDKAVLLMFLALKSIVGEKKYYKLTNKSILFNRMAGQDDKCETLPKEIAKFCTRYQVGKIEMDLMDKYNVSIYAYHTRGKYYSFKMTIEELAKVAEGKKQGNRRKKHSDEAKQAYKKAKQQANKTDTMKELERIKEFLAQHPELKSFCT